MKCFHLRDEEWAICERLYFLHLKRVEYPLVLGPGDELEGGVALDVAVNDPAQVERKILDGGGVHHAARVWNRVNNVQSCQVAAREENVRVTLECA